MRTGGEVRQRTESLDEYEGHVEEWASWEGVFEGDSTSRRHEMLHVGGCGRLVALETGQLLGLSKFFVANQQQLFALEVGVAVRRQIRS